MIYFEIPFEFTSFYKNSRKITDYFSMNVIANVNGIDAYFQIDTACPATMLDEDFFDNYVRNNKVKKIRRKIDGNWFTNELPHTTNIKITFNNNTVFAPDIICLEKNQTKAFTSNTNVVYHSKLPFAGYIGLDWMANKMVEIDYVNQVICFHNTLPGKYLTTQNTPLLQAQSAILLPTYLNGCFFYSVFDTASSAHTLILEQRLFKRLFGKLTTKSHNTIVRPDFLLREYYVEQNVQLQIGNFIYHKKTTLTTVDKKTNNYYFAHQLEHPRLAILGNIPFLNHSIFFDLKRNLFYIH